MERKYVSDHVDYMLDWDFSKNKIMNNQPDKITLGSRKRVYWKCHVCSGQWNTVMKERRGCPYCSGFKALSGFNDLATLYPELASEWDYGKNAGLTPQDVTQGSQKKVYWKCKKGHSWDAQVNTRVSGQGCPYCNNRRVLHGYNDLATIHPELAKEWHPTKNGSLRPTDVVTGTKKKVWWSCEKGHEWLAQVSNRVRGNGCPICANRIIVKNYNDFAWEHPELLNEWDYSRNDKNPSEYACFSREKVWWICKRGHRFKAAIGDRSKGTGCAKCAEERRVSFPEKAVLYYIRKHYPNAMANYRTEWLGPYELDIYIPELRVGIEYDGVYGHGTDTGIKRDLRKNKVCHINNVSLIRLREKGCKATEDTSFDYVMRSRDDLVNALSFVFETIKEISGDSPDFSRAEINIDQDSGEIYSLIEYIEKENSLLTRYPEIAELWHPLKNGRLIPEYVQPGSPKKVWWLGKCGHEWRSAISYEVASGKCPYCTGKRVLAGFNDLASINPDLANEWDRNKNEGLNATDVTAGSGSKVWWRCEKGHSWKASVVSRNRGNRCPICANRIVLEGYNDVASYPDLLNSWNYSKNGKLKPTETCIGIEKKIWWICPDCGYEWKASVAGRARGRGCPECMKKIRTNNSRKTYVEKRGSFAQMHSELLAEWDYKRNKDVMPESIVSGYGRKVWWICKNCSSEWEATVASRSAGRGCPFCADRIRAASRRKKLLEKKKPLSITHPELCTEWDFNRNSELTPDYITAGSGKRIWWKCNKCGAEWNSPVCERTRGRGQCPACRQK